MATRTAMQPPTPAADAAASVLYRSLTRADPRGVAVLQGTNPEWASTRLRGCPERVLPPGAVLLQRGLRTRNVYLVVSGLLSIHAQAGDEAPHSVARPGEIVGELSVLSGAPATMEVRALTPASVVEIDEDTFSCLIHESHVFAINVILLLTSRLRRSASVLTAVADRQRTLEAAVTRDVLTGLHNRRWLDEMLPACCEQARLDGGPLTVLMADIDHFKRINDTHGHAEGDRALVAVARALAGGLRQTDLIARFGGEEFVVLLPREDATRGAVIAERLRRAVAAQPVPLGDGPAPTTITVSIGLSEMLPGDDPELLLERADRALYRAKAAGRDRIAVEPG